MRYKILKRNKLQFGIYSLVPIRQQDKYKIMKWRNEQAYHLRQNGKLTKKDQEKYYSTIIKDLFKMDKPDQLLFSYLKNDECIGYGGLVHIDWNNLNAEISFIMETSREKDEFYMHWSNYLKLLEEIAFKDLKFKKIYTFAYDLRPHLFDAIEKCGYILEGTLKKHYLLEDKFYDVKIHSKLRCLN